MHSNYVKLKIVNCFLCVTYSDIYEDHILLPVKNLRVESYSIMCFCPSLYRIHFDQAWIKLVRTPV